MIRFTNHIGIYYACRINMVFVNRSLCLFTVLILFVLSLCPCQCDMSGKIVGGDYGKIRHYPHAVFLDAQAGREGWACGASVLNQRMILTAAHCLEKIDLRALGHNVFAFAGNEDYSAKNAVKRALKQLVLHENYVEKSMINDIGLGELAFYFPLNDNIKRVILPNRFSAEINGVVTGWGVVDEDTERSESKMKFLSQQLQPRNVCSRLRGMRSPNMFCASNSRTHKHHPSLGDSGSGFVTPKGEILGLVSYRDQDWIHLLVYTNVSYHLDWIKTNSRRMVCRI